jgi:dTDP-4-dehydrorhamnose 3,5-epimerase
MKAIDLDLEGAKLISPSVFKDARGFFIETYQRDRYSELGIELAFVQDNHSRSTRGTLRGLHYQSSPGQAKLVSVVRGQIYDVIVDIRPDSPTFGRHYGCLLDDVQNQQLFVPVGMAHGFCVLSEVADVCYKVSSSYIAATECGIRFDDLDLAIAWPIADPLVSERDRNTESFADYRRRTST